ncbi:potassium-transporting ATPase subunit KdpC [Desulfotomaculum copahuensis]|uniref:Potassium-transporting ATPase KdpC subunit n=1 Tax=Desulfotomaculum copahuensis TaxID=1838280 RepID=A0A1B7LI32_9FIRM|nr:potassium-transporting ATPase subunit KdpC [Desulfotomaculum copahuensis]OAT86075.1 K+-transporting ATPase subunit C [Desulfotomaculum copahuensis]
MTRTIMQSLRLILVLTLLAGLLYPLAVTGLASAFFPARAAGSLVVQNGRVAGSRLIGQEFNSPRYFHGRPSAAGGGYDAAASGGANAGPTSNALLNSVRANLSRVEKQNPGVTPGTVPVDLVTVSASGLDPDISPAAALLQVPRVAAARGLPEDKVKALVMACIKGRQLGLLGEPRVNVLELNLALDRLPG